VLFPLGAERIYDEKKKRSKKLTVDKNRVWTKVEFQKKNILIFIYYQVHLHYYNIIQRAYKIDIDYKRERTFDSSTF